tara:strand:- start:1 stop:330 length:330 start_codon:yes stop_codon:yes gene_type:complete
MKKNKYSKVSWRGSNDYNINCHLEELPFKWLNNSYRNDLCPSFINEEETLQIYFCNTNLKEMKLESMKYKFNLYNYDKVEGCLDDNQNTWFQTNNFSKLVEEIKKRYLH